MTGRQKVAAIVAEFVGTYVLATVMLAMLARTEFAFFSAIPAAIVYGLMYLIFGSASGSHLNPVVTIGLWTMRKVPTVQAIAYIIVQMLAGYVAYRAGQYFLGQPLSHLATGGIDWKVLIAEGVGTIVFGMGVASAILHKADAARYAVITGLALVAGISIASLAGNGLLNPAVALAIKSWSWAYVVGPIIGAVVGMNLCS
jgi:glycerol uptake facilitator-like aquaporin